VESEEKKEKSGEKKNRVRKKNGGSTFRHYGYEGGSYAGSAGEEAVPATNKREPTQEDKKKTSATIQMPVPANQEKKGLKIRVLG